MDYLSLLKKARKDLPDSAKQQERFAIPKVKGRIQGNRTYIVNFPELVDTLHRPGDHLIKFLSKELGAPAHLAKNNTLILNSKVAAAMINKKVEQYASEYVLCNECGKPDTRILTEDGGTFLKCTACGAKYPIRSRI